MSRFSRFLPRSPVLRFFLVCGALSTALLVILVVVVRARGSAKVPDGAYLVFDLGAAVHESQDDEGLNDMLTRSLAGQAPDAKMRLRPALRALRAAATDARIKGLFLSGPEVSTPSASGLAPYHELRDAIVAFAGSGKPVKAFLRTATARTYYVASAANEIVMDPFGVFQVAGLAAEPVFFTGMLEKLGVGVQVLRVGKFKSAVEPFIRRDMSEESRAQTKALLDDLWGEVASTIEAARKLPAGKLQTVLDANGMMRPAQAKEAGLIDRTAYWDEVLTELRTATGVTKAGEAPKQVTLATYARAMEEASESPKGDGKLAIVWAEGAIVGGKGQGGTIGGTRFARELRKLREDEDVKAVVLRVSSPGGSASASEEIQREMRLLLAKKPVVVSMGGVAASGGYWISAYSSRVFADPMTITGSIGVFGLLFNTRELGNKVGVSWDVVKTGRFADLESVARPKTPEEIAVVQSQVDWIYGEFLSKVVEGRKLPREKVEEIAQGRVWSGKAALKLGLVDELGGLEAAVRFARDKAGLPEGCAVVEAPRHRDFFARLVASFRPDGDEAEDAAIDPVAASGALARPGTVAAELAAPWQRAWQLASELDDRASVYARLAELPVLR